MQKNTFLLVLSIVLKQFIYLQDLKVYGLLILGTSIKVPENDIDWNIKGYIKTHKTTYILMEEPVEKNIGFEKKILLFIQNDDMKSNSIETTIESLAEINRQENLHVYLIDPLTETFLIYAVFGRFIILFHYAKLSNSITYSYTFTAPKNMCQLFFIPNKQIFVFNDSSMIFFFDNKLSLKIHQLGIGFPFRICFVSKDQHHLILSNEEIYWELSLLTFRNRKQIMYNDHNSETVYYVLDREIFPLNKNIVNFCQQISQSKTKLVIFDSFDFMNLDEFPFFHLKSCFKRNNYLPSIQAFSQYYFSIVSVHNNHDHLYGPLNPQIMLIYHNDYIALEDNLENYKYISNHEWFLSPLEYTFKLNYFNCTKTICEHLVKYPEQIFLSRRDFQLLLDSNYLYCHRLLAMVFQKHENYPISSMVYLSGEFKLYMDRNYLLVGSEILERNKQKKKTLERFVDHSNMLEYNSIESSYFSLHKTEVEIFCPEILLDFKYGSQDSMLFLDNYVSTPCSDFLASNWKFLVKKKWRYLKILYLFLFFVYYAFAILFTLTIIFFRENNTVRICTFIPIVMLFLFEILEIISFSAFRPSRYFLDLLNYVDLFILLNSSVFLVLFTSSNKEKDWHKIWQMIVQFAIYYRGFSYMRIFDSFTTIVSMINTIIIKIYAFLFVVFYFYFAIVFLMIGITSISDAVNHLRDVYYWVLFGGIDDDSFEVNLSFVAILFGTILISIILMNILIAYLSNLFSSLEETQVLDDLREKASFVLGIEVIIRFFRYFLSRKIKLIEAVEKHNYESLLSFESNDENKLKVNTDNQ